MIAADTIVERIHSGEKYLALVDGGLTGSWRDLRLEALRTADLILALALVHPLFWDEVSTREAVLGPRSFSVPSLSGTRYCASADIWGVECPSRGRSGIEVVADHDWPYSLGGPTQVGNIRWLCRRHNAVKSSDVHLFAWDGPWPGWLAGQLQKLERIVQDY